MLVFTREEKKQLLARFPPLELSYENILHKKVYADVYVLIPNGQKAFVWFTYWHDKNVCLLLRLNEKNNICDITPFTACFAAALAHNTVIYGTFFLNNTLAHFSCEDLFYYKNMSVVKSPFSTKLRLLQEMFATEVTQAAYTTDCLVLGLPVMKTNYDQLIACINGLAYSVQGVRFCNVTQNSDQGLYRFNKPVVPEVVLHVKATVDADIYHLYCADNVFYGTAFVPSYKASVYLNALFRRIRENINLDLLEESEDENDYENTNVDKFVDLEKSYNMRCVYNRKFRKWQPVEVVGGEKTVARIEEMQKTTF
jgi:hypothetical protein